MQYMGSSPGRASTKPKIVDDGQGGGVDEEAKTEFKKNVPENGEAKTNLSLEEIQQQVEDAAKSMSYSTKKLRRHEESKVPEEVRRCERAAATSENPKKRLGDNT